MFKSFIILAFRNLSRDKYSTALYFLLLIVGISSFAIISTIYQHEITYDRFMKDGDKIYRSTTYFKRGDQEVKWAITNGHLPVIMKENIPEIEDATKFQTIQASQVIVIGEKKFEIPERQGFYTDPNFFSVLDYPLSQGDSETALTEPNSIVISQKYASRFFNRTDVVGETLDVENPDKSRTSYKITGVLANIPSNSHLQFDMLISGNTFGHWESMSSPGRGFPVHVYFKTNGSYDTKFLNDKVQAEADKVYVNANGEPRGLFFPVQPFHEIHFNAENLFEAGVTGNLLFTRILMAVGLVIIAIACINFSILYTSKSLSRAKEIGIRKTLGSSQGAIATRLLAESCLLSILCAILALGTAELLLKSVVKTHLYEAELSILSSPELIGVILLTGLILGLISGFYVASKSAFFSSSQILRGRLKMQKGSFLGGRNLLVIFQFVLTSVLITASLMFIKQVNYIEQKDVGYERVSIINLTRPSNLSPAMFEVFRQSLESESNVAGTGYMLYDFIGDYNAGGFSIEHEGDTLSVRGQSNYIDPGIIPTLGLQIVEGRNFSDEIQGDSASVIINEAAKRKLGLDEVAGKSFTYQVFGYTPKIVGVVKDFHFQSFMKEIPPLILYKNRGDYFRKNLMVKLSSANPDEAIKRVKAKWDDVAAGVPFEPSFLEDSFMGLVEKETRLTKMISTYTIVSIIVACLGLVGLVRYTNEQRKKEMGIRKVYGASEKSIMQLINGYFGKLILAAVLVAVPLSVFGIDKWLNSFAYHTEQGPLEYVITAILLVGFALLVTSLQTLKAARSNPVDVLKEE